MDYMDLTKEPDDSIKSPSVKTLVPHLTIPVTLETSINKRRRSYRTKYTCYRCRVEFYSTRDPNKIDRNGVFVPELVPTKRFKCRDIYDLDMTNKQTFCRRCIEDNRARCNFCCRTFHGIIRVPRTTPLVKTVATTIDDLPLGMMNPFIPESAVSLVEEIFVTDRQHARVIYCSLCNKSIICHSCLVDNCYTMIERRSYFPNKPIDTWITLSDFYTIDYKKKRVLSNTTETKVFPKYWESRNYGKENALLTYRKCDLPSAKVDLEMERYRDMYSSSRGAGMSKYKQTSFFSEIVDYKCGHCRDTKTHKKQLALEHLKIDIDRVLGFRPHYPISVYISGRLVVFDKAVLSVRAPSMINFC